MDTAALPYIAATATVVALVGVVLGIGISAGRALCDWLFK